MLVMNRGEQSLLQLLVARRIAGCDFQLGRELFQSIVKRVHEVGF